MNILERLRQKLRPQRSATPRLRLALTQELHTTALSPSYRLVHLAVTLHNLSHQETRHYHVLTAALAQVAPLNDQEIKDLIQQDQDQPIRDGSPRYAWPPLPPGIGPHPALPATIPANSRQTCHFSFQIPAETTCVEATVLLQPSNPAPALPYGQPQQSWRNIGIYDLPPPPGKDRQNRYNNDSPPESQRHPHVMTLIEGEKLPKTHPNALVEWPAGKPPGGIPLHIPGSETPAPSAPKPQPEESPC